MNFDDPEYFSGIDKDTADYLEKQGVGYIERLEDSYKSIRGRCEKLSVILCASSAALFIILLTQKVEVPSVLFFLIVSWGCIAANLIFQTQEAKNRGTAWAIPHKIYKDGVSLDHIKKVRLCSYSIVANLIQEENVRMGKAFNRSLRWIAVSGFLSVCLGYLFLMLNP